jgi:transcriptional pleiotropic regulator of transition state genes
MKSKRTIRNLDVLGRVVIPVSMRREYDIKSSDPLEIYVNDNSIILKKANSSCIFCGSKTSLINFKNKKICRKCLEDFKE